MITEIVVALIQDSIYSTLLISRWFVGSSKSNNPGLRAKALAMATFFCSPPERDSIRLSEEKSSPMSVMAARKDLSISHRLSFSIFSPRDV